MSATGVTVQPDIAPLLEQAGARPRGKRHDCPKCGRLRTLTHTAETFFCHGCQWTGNAITLQKELGIYQRLPSPDYRELRRKRERAHEAAERLYEAARQRRLELYRTLREMGRAELAAREAGPESESAWEVLEAAYKLPPTVEAALKRLESNDPATVLEGLK